jgi:transcription elongation factor Elf1
MEQVKALDNKFTCLECQNEVVLDPEKKVGDIVECPYCGIEYEITGKDEAGVTLQLIEEEK